MEEIPGAVKNQIAIQYNENFDRYDFNDRYRNTDEIIYVVEGEAEININLRTYPVRAGDIIFIGSLESHRVTIRQYPYKRYSVLLKARQLRLLNEQPVLASIFKSRPEVFSQVLSLDEGSRDEVNMIFRRMAKEYEADDMFCKEAIESSLDQLFILLYRRYKDVFPLYPVEPQRSDIVEIQRYIEENFTENLNLTDVSRLFCRDIFYVSHMFKKITGFTFREYLILLRLAKARELLYTTRDDITAVGVNSGFNSINHFIRIFKKYEGMTPNQYRKEFIRRQAV